MSGSSREQGEHGPLPFSPGVLEPRASGAPFTSRPCVLPDFQKKRMGLKLERANLYVLEPLLNKTPENCPILSFPQKEDRGVHPSRAGTLSLTLLQSVGTVPGT